jgi:hypothetical protein
MLRDADLSAARHLRAAPVEACAAGDFVWLRGPELGPQFAAALLKLPALERGVPDTGGAVRRRDGSLPFARLPDGPWRLLRDVLSPARHERLEPGPPPATVALQLVRGWRDFSKTGDARDDPASPAAMLVPADGFAAYAFVAPAVRLRRWSFALSSDGQALVLGAPLPPLPGVALIDRGRLLIEAGFVWQPDLSPAAVRRALAPQIVANDWVLWTSHGAEVVPASSFVAASRSAVRLSLLEAARPPELGG